MPEDDLSQVEPQHREAVFRVTVLNTLRTQGELIDELIKEVKSLREWRIKIIAWAGAFSTAVSLAVKYLPK